MHWRRINGKKQTFKISLPCNATSSPWSSLIPSEANGWFSLTSFLLVNISFKSSMLLSWRAIVTQANKWLTVMRNAYSNVIFSTHRGTSIFFIPFELIAILNVLTFQSTCAKQKTMLQTTKFRGYLDIAVLPRKLLFDNADSICLHTTIVLTCIQKIWIFNTPSVHIDHNNKTCHRKVYKRAILPSALG